MSDVAAEFQQDDEDTAKRKAFALVDAHANQLSEHFDSVVIIVSTDHGPKNGSQYCSSGVGNWYARYGMVQAWLKHENKHL